MKEADTDVIITLGAGTLSDGAKAIAMVSSEHCLQPMSIADTYKAVTYKVKTREDLLNLPHAINTKGSCLDLKAPTTPIISIPTTLSGGEYSNYAGCTDDVNEIKYQFSVTLKGPLLSFSTPHSPSPPPCTPGSTLAFVLQTTALRFSSHYTAT